MTDEEKRNEVIDRLGGTSRLKKLEELVEELHDRVNELEDDSRLVPGVKLVGLESNRWIDTGAAIEPFMASTYELQAIGYDWAVVRDTATDAIYFRRGHDLRDELRQALEL